MQNKSFGEVKKLPNFKLKSDTLQRKQIYQTYMNSSEHAGLGKGAQSQQTNWK